MNNTIIKYVKAGNYWNIILFVSFLNSSFTTQRLNDLEYLHFLSLEYETMFYTVKQ